MGKLNVKKNIVVVLVTLLMASCVNTTYLSNGSKYVVSVNSWGNYDLKGKTFYIESGNERVLSTDLEFREYSDYLAEDLRLEGAIITTDKKNADMCILMNYSIADESYTETIPVPIYGRTGISSINTTSGTRGSAYGSAYSLGGFTLGSISGNSTTNTQTNVKYNYGVTGYHNVDRRVTQFARVVNVYAFDNKNTSSEPIMLWKTNLYSLGSSSDFRKVMPYIMYIGWEGLGNNTGGWNEYIVYENDYIFKCWKQKVLSNPYLTIAPEYEYTNASSQFKICFVEKLQNETIIGLRKTGCSQYKISPYTYIQYNGERVRVSYADNYELGSKIKQECGTRYFRLHFPVNLDDVKSFDFVEYKTAKEKDFDLRWRGIKTK